jgi:LPXTG-motif cell wall-anchored protein
MTNPLDSPSTDVYNTPTEPLPPAMIEPTPIPKPELSPCPAQPCPYVATTVQPAKPVQADSGYLPNTGQSITILAVLAVILILTGVYAWWRGR